MNTGIHGIRTDKARLLPYGASGDPTCARAVMVHLHLPGKLLAFGPLIPFIPLSAHFASQETRIRAFCPVICPQHRPGVSHTRIFAPCHAIHSRIICFAVEASTWPRPFGSVCLADSIGPSAMSDSDVSGTPQSTGWNSPRRRPTPCPAHSPPRQPPPLRHPLPTHLAQRQCSHAAPRRAERAAIVCLVAASGGMHTHMVS